MTIITIGHGLAPFVGGVSGALNLVKGADIAAAPAIDLAGASGNYLTVTGNGASVSSLGTAPAGAQRVVRFAGAVTLVHNAASLVLPGAASLTTSADDIALFVSEGGGAWRCAAYTLAAYAPGSGGGGSGGTGPRGPAGTPGSVWYSGSGVPSSATGIAGDYYLNLATGDVYARGAASWGSAIGNLKGAAGAAGATGAQGAAGSAGAAGATGPQGPAGAAGSMWYEGSTAPSAGTGANGDHYLNTATGDVYVKASGAWGSAIGNIRGPQGPAGSGSPGSTWYSGSGAPSAGTGINGDYYLNITTGDVYTKSSGSWGSAIANLKGAAGATGATGPAGSTGATGATGAAGTTGAAGANGAVWYSGSGAPSSGTGANGDYYLNIATGDVYTKSSGSWGSAVANLKGATGATGTTGAAGTAGSAWWNGAGAPAAGTGANGDFYLNSATGDVYTKSSGSWGSAVANIKGPSGGGAGLTVTSPVYVSSGGTTTVTGTAVVAAYEQLAGQTFNVTYNTRSDYAEQDATNGTDWAAGAFQLHQVASPDTSTSCLLHFDSDYSDSSPNALTITNHGASISAAQKKFGAASANFNGTSSYLTGPTGNAAFQFPGDFTIEGWVNLTENNSTNFILFSTNYANNTATGISFCVADYGSGVFRLYAYSNNGYLISHAGLTPFNAGTWTHIAMVRSGSTLSLAVGGVWSGTTTTSQNFSDGGCSINCNTSGTGGAMLGTLDEFRVSKTARYTPGVNFTPPAAAFTVSTASYAARPYYVATTAASQISLAAFDAIYSATVTATQPANTALRFLVSFDGRTTWKSNTSGSSWLSVALSAANIDSSGMTAAQLQTALASWTPSLGTTLDVAASFKTGDTTVTPSLDNVLVTMDKYTLMIPGTDYAVSKSKSGSQTLTFTRLKAGNANHELAVA
ncbi:MAG: LamG domain-containing protein [Rhodospirillaceae bacterium]